MNKPAAKEPSMDEILSSIRQIIADDDAAAVTESMPPLSATAAVAEEAADEGFPSFDAFLAEEAPESVAETAPEPEPEVETEAEMEDEADALALSFDQIVEDAGEAEETEPFGAGLDVDLPDLSGSGADVDGEFSLPDDVAFVADDTSETEPMPAEAAVRDTSTMPDTTLSSDIAERLLDSTAAAAAGHAFARLGTLSLGAGSQTIEGVVKELLRPMLKSWLDENLPSIVERLVEREIERVSRGGR